jgi:hypothetical protein
MSDQLDAARFPVTAAYLAVLPAGLDSYPQCQAKASLYRALVDDMTADGLPAPLRDLVVQPRPVTAWISEVHTHALLLAHYDMHGHDPASFAAFTYATQRALWSSKLYSILMKLLAPARMLAGASTRWSQFHRGTELHATPTDVGRAELVLRHPPLLYDAISLIGLTEGLRAALDVSRVTSQLTMVASDELGARWQVSWSE